LTVAELVRPPLTVFVVSVLLVDHPPLMVPLVVRRCVAAAVDDAGIAEHATVGPPPLMVLVLVLVSVLLPLFAVPPVVVTVPLLVNVPAVLTPSSRSKACRPNCHCRRRGRIVGKRRRRCITVDRHRPSAVVGERLLPVSAAVTVKEPVLVIVLIACCLRRPGVGQPAGCCVERARGRQHAGGGVVEAVRSWSRCRCW
jgi:hypothetical protein